MQILHIRSEIFNKHTIKYNQLFGKNIEGTLIQILKFINKSKVFTKLPKWSKRDLSPNRLIDPNQKKRCKPNSSKDIQNTPKKSKP